MLVKPFFNLMFPCHLRRIEPFFCKHPPRFDGFTKFDLAKEGLDLLYLKSHPNQSHSNLQLLQPFSFHSSVLPARKAMLRTAAKEGDSLPSIEVDEGK